MQVFGDEADMYKLEDVQMNDFGTVKEVTVTKDDTLMMKASLCLSLIKNFHDLWFSEIFYFFFFKICLQLRPKNAI